MRDVDFVSCLLPSHLKCDWLRKYHDMSTTEKIHPFIPFMKFLERGRETVARLAERPIPKTKVPDATKNARTHQAEVFPTQMSSKQYYKCAYPAHRKDAVKHNTEDCREFQKLTNGGKDGKLEMLKQVNACFLCFGDHRRSECTKKRACSSCGSDKHHVMLCKSGKQENTPKTINQPQVKGGSHVCRRENLALYPIQQANVCEIDKNVTVFCDGGSNTTYITHKSADEIKAQRLNKYTLDVTTMGDVETTYDTVEYQFTLKTINGRKVDIRAYGMERITGLVSRLDLDTIAELFPDFDSESLQRKSSEVDVLLGCDFFGLHPKKEEAVCGDNLSVMSGEFGICLESTHPRLKEETALDSNLAKIVHSSKIKTALHHARVKTHEEFQPRLCGDDMKTPVDRETSKNAVNAIHVVRGRKEEVQVENVIRGEELGTETTPRCGGCRCNKCPTLGHTYSFKEEQELKMIRENLEYDEENQRWTTRYPWITDPATLPNNYNSALSTLKSTERTLSKDKEWADTYQKQMKDMIDLFGPYSVRGEVQKHVSGKAYGVIFTDLTMRAVHIKAVYGYATSSFLLALSRFASVRGWPQTIYSDPGSQLVGVDRELKDAWKEINQEALQKDAAEKGLTWAFGPADSPWYQGAVEALVKSAKRAIHFAVHNQRLSVAEFLTLCSEVANLLNERPIGSIPSNDSELNVLTPNSLILGRATAVNPHGWQPRGSSIVTRYRLVQALTDEFWRKWTELYAPTLVVQKKWNTSCRNLKPGDVVIVADRNTLRGEYRLAEVKDVLPSADGKVRQVTVRYKTYKVGEKVSHYSGAKYVVVSRSVHRLALLVPVDYCPDLAEDELKKSLKEH